VDQAVVPLLRPIGEREGEERREMEEGEEKGERAWEGEEMGSRWMPLFQIPKYATEWL